MPGAPLIEEWQRLAKAGVINRTAAARLGISEATLVASGVGVVATRIKAEPLAWLQATRELGPVKYVVRNDHAVMERSGALDDIDAREAIEAHGPVLSLTLQREEIGSAFALEEPRPEGAKRSLQLFDRRGVTLIKVVCRDMADGRAFATVRERLRIENEALPIADEQPAARTTGLGRDAPAHDSPLQHVTLHDFLRAAAHQGIALAISVGNGGARLATTTVIQRVKRSSRAPWVNVLDPGLDLHLHEARLQKLAVTRRPDGDTLSWIADDGVVAVTFTVPVGASETLAKALASGETPD